MWWSGLKAIDQRALARGHSTTPLLRERKDKINHIVIKLRGSLDVHASSYTLSFFSREFRSKEGTSGVEGEASRLQPRSPFPSLLPPRAPRSPFPSLLAELELLAASSSPRERET